MHFNKTEKDWVVNDSRSGMKESLKILAHRNYYNINEMCAELKRSHRYVYNIFMRDIGVPPQRWVDAQRMHLARQKLISKMPIRDVSDMLGYSDVVAFTRRFARVHGLPPRRYVNQRTD